MQTRPGTIVLMGSGELTATMVEVHKALLRGFGPEATAVFIDTPAGFQLNADQIAQKAHDYFRSRVLHPLRLVSYKSRRHLDHPDTQRNFELLNQADYILVGPGSPTYALRQWRQSPVPTILCERLRAGACLTVASAAALTIGTHALPVYEIYKVGEDLHWTPGLDILGEFGLKWVVVPHWNNAEGGNHDTRFCFMGAGRFATLEAMLPEHTGIVGVDEHTAVILDLGRRWAQVGGIGRVTLRRDGRTWGVFTKGEGFSLDWLEQEPGQARRAAVEPPEFRQSTGQPVADDRISTTPNAEESAGLCAELIDRVLDLRARLKQDKQYELADALRDCLQRTGVVVQDTPEGPRWRPAGR